MNLLVVCDVAALRYNTVGCYILQKKVSLQTVLYTLLHLQDNLVVGVAQVHEIHQKLYIVSRIDNVSDTNRFCVFRRDAKQCFCLV